MTKIEQEFWQRVNSSQVVHINKKFSSVLAKRKKEVAKQNKDLIPYEYDDTCRTCGTTGKEHPETAYCFICDTDNWD